MLKIYGPETAKPYTVALETDFDDLEVFYVMLGQAIREYIEARTHEESYFCDGRYFSDAETGYLLYGAGKIADAIRALPRVEDGPKGTFWFGLKRPPDVKPVVSKGEPENYLSEITPTGDFT